MPAMDVFASWASLSTGSSISTAISSSPSSPIPSNASNAAGQAGVIVSGLPGSVANLGGSTIAQATAAGSGYAAQAQSALGDIGGSVSDVFGSFSGQASQYMGEAGEYLGAAQGAVGEIGTYVQRGSELVQQAASTVSAISSTVASTWGAVTGVWSDLKKTWDPPKAHFAIVYQVVGLNQLGDNGTDEGWIDYLGNEIQAFAGSSGGAEVWWKLYEDPSNIGGKTNAKNYYCRKLVNVDFQKWITATGKLWGFAPSGPMLSADSYDRWISPGTRTPPKQLAPAQVEGLRQQVVSLETTLEQKMAANQAIIADVGLNAWGADVHVSPSVMENTARQLYRDYWYAMGLKSCKEAVSAYQTGKLSLDDESWWGLGYVSANYAAQTAMYQRVLADDVAALANPKNANRDQLWRNSVADEARRYENLLAAGSKG